MAAMGYERHRARLGDYPDLVVLHLIPQRKKHQGISALLVFGVEGNVSTVRTLREKN